MEPTPPDAQPPASRLRAWLTPWLEGLGGEPTVVVCGASAVLVASHYQGSSGFYRVLFGTRFDSLPWAAAMGHFWWFGTSLVFYLVIPLLLAVATRGSFHERYGLGLGDWRLGLTVTGVLLAVMLPLTAVAATLPSFKGMYPLAGNGAYLLTTGPGQTEVSWGLFLSYEAAYFAYFIAWEFLFRGWMVHGLAPHWGRTPAVLVQVAPFAVMHLGKPELEALGSVIAGVALGVLSLRTRSFWYGALLHGVVAIWMDFLAARHALLAA
jgi:membrane protease YdiL (CAAX protease family)